MGKHRTPAEILAEKEASLRKTRIRAARKQFSTHPSVLELDAKIKAARADKVNTERIAENWQERIENFEARIEKIRQEGSTASDRLPVIAETLDRLTAERNSLLDELISNAVE